VNVYQKLTHPAALAVFVVTLFLPVIIGLLVRKRTRCQSDFFLGGRRLSRFSIALSAVASGRSSWLVLGVSGMAYTMGVAAVWSVVGYITAEMVQFVAIGGRLRRLSEKYDAMTLLDFFESHFEDGRQLIRRVGAVIMGIFLVAYVAAQFNAGANSLSVALKLPLAVSLLIASALVLAYMMLGGYLAVVYNDVVRALIMIVGLVLFPLYGLVKLGGLPALLTTLEALDPARINPLALSFGALVGFLGIGLGSPGQPHVVVRYMTIADPAKLRYSAVIGTFWNVVLGWGAVFIGLIGRAMIPDVSAVPDANPEMIYLVLSAQFFSPVLYGLLIGGIFAAILSTADSQLLVVSSTLVRDLYEKILRRDRPLPESKKLGLCRWVVLGSGLVSVILAYLAKDLVFWLVLFAWGGLGASFGTALILSLYWKRTNVPGIVAGMVTGTLTTILWKLFLKDATGVYELIPAFVLALGAIVLFGVFSRKGDDRLGPFN
jgi:solute:Na+ symporter, SSS family